MPEFGSNRLRYVSKGREVGVTGPSNLRLWWTLQALAENPQALACNEIGSMRATVHTRAQGAAETGWDLGPSQSGSFRFQPPPRAR